MENLRFIEPVKPGDTIQVRLTCKRKTLKKQRTPDEKPTGVVEWSVEIYNQHQQAVALYSILTLVARQQGVIGIISAAAFSFMVQDPSGIIARSSARSRSDRRRI